MWDKTKERRFLTDELLASFVNHDPLLRPLHLRDEKPSCLYAYIGVKGVRFHFRKFGAQGYESVFLGELGEITTEEARKRAKELDSQSREKRIAKRLAAKAQRTQAKEEQHGKTNEEVAVHQGMGSSRPRNHYAPAG
jgi:hypothetical protein